MRVYCIFYLLLFINFSINGQLKINEILTSNVNGILDEDYAFSDWIELYNSGGTAINLNGYALSDDLSLPGKWTFPGITIVPSQYLLIFASDKDRKDLPVVYETLIDMGDVWRYLVPNSDIGTGWHDLGYDDSGWALGKSGFGFGDNDDSTIIASSTISVFIRKEFTITDITSIQKMILHVDYDDAYVAYINGQEVARASVGTPGEIIPYDRVADESHEALMWQGGEPNYFEVADPASILVEGTNVIAIQGHNISNTSSDFSLIPFLSIGRLGEGEDNISPYISVPPSGGLHTNFKLKAEGESVYLFNTVGSLIDSVGGVTLPNDVSFGRKPDGSMQWLYFAEPTPNAANSTPGVEGGITRTVVISPQGGKHLGGVSITMTTGNSQDTIYYTNDGSIPDRSTYRCTGSIYIGHSQVIRARVLSSSSLPGEVTTNTYVIELNHEFPIVCLSTDPYNLWDELSGIFAFGPNAESSYPYFGANFWQDWERPVHFELYDQSGYKRIDQGAGIKVFGGWSRGSDQKSVSLFARNEYGKGSFEYQFFQDKPITKFESIVLRNSGNDNMGLQFQDCFLTGLTRGMDIDRQAYQPSAVYINGEYWGILNIREKINEHYVAGNYNLDKDNINLIEQQSSIIHGSNNDYLEILDFLNTNASLSSDERYAWISDQININNYIQYQLTEIYINNQDWPGNNIKFWNTITPDSKWRWIIFDTDFGYGIWNLNDYQINTLDFALEPNGPGWPNPPWSTLMFRRLVTNLNYRHNFINQYCDRLNVDFHPSRINSDLDSLKDLYNTEIQYHIDRWWGTYAEWLGRVENRRTFGELRPSYARSHMQQVFSLGEETEITIDVSDEAEGKVKVNTVVPKTYPFTGIYFEDIPIRLTAIPKPGYKFIRWEGQMNSTDVSIQYNMASEASFKAIFAEADASDISIVINEINYASADNWDTKDWIELLNNGNTALDLKDWLLSDSGPDTGFYFPEGIILYPGDYLVICRDLNNFFEFNPDVQNAVGEFPFGLSSSGDMIRLYDDESNLMDAVDYYPYSPWPENAVGTGSSIELIHPDLDNTRGENWQASGLGGTPGTNNTGYVPIDIPVSIAPALKLECFPNPFHDYTTIQFTVSQEGYYRLEVFDVNGRLLDVLADEYLAQDTYYIDWFGSKSSTRELSGSVFTIRLSTNNTLETVKLIMIK